jgi:hypothetical protein
MIAPIYNQFFPSSFLYGCNALRQFWRTSTHSPISTTLTLPEEVCMSKHYIRELSSQENSRQRVQHNNRPWPSSRFNGDTLGMLPRRCHSLCALSSCSPSRRFFTRGERNVPVIMQENENMLWINARGTRHDDDGSQSSESRPLWHRDSCSREEHLWTTPRRPLVCRPSSATENSKWNINLICF